MAEIVKACDTSVPSRPLVAVKRILPHLCEDEQYTTMFLDESRVLTQLDHPNIIHAFEVGEIEATPYIALDYVDGQDARSLFQRTRSGDTRVPVAIACYLVACVCDGLHHAHEQKDQAGQSLGLVHRDVSLQNILLSYTGDVKLTDFGIAVSSQNLARTAAGIVKGKFGYMSPEQIKGAALDRRSDVFGAGICLYELLTGERLFAGDNDYKAIERVRNVEIEPPSAWNRAIPSALEAIVLHALAKNPRDRYQTALELRSALLAFMAAAGERCTRDDLGQYLRQVFAHEYALEREVGSETFRGPAPLPANPVHPQTTPERARRPAGGAAAPARESNGSSSEVDPDALTGLMAFDHLDPISALHFPESEPKTGDFEPPKGAASIPSLRNARVAAAPSSAPVAQLAPLVSSKDEGVAPRILPVVPPIVPSSDSIPGTLHADELFGDITPNRSRTPERTRPDAVVPGPRPLMMDWDEHEPTTISRGFDHVTPPLAGMDMEDEVTRLRLDDYPSGPLSALQSGPFPPTLELPKSTATLEAAVPEARLPTLSAWPKAVWRTPLTGPYKVVLGIVAATCVAVLAILVVHGRAPATLRLTTDPKDALVTVNGEPAPGSSSPYVLSELDSSIEHTIEVNKAGYQGWSTRLRLRPDQVLDVPLVRLEALEPPSPVPVATPIAVTPTPTPATPAVQPPRTPPARARDKRTAAREKPASTKTSAPRASTTQPPSARGGQAPAPARDAKLGSLRINTRPWSRVTVDGKLIGNTPQMNIPLAAGTHKVSLVNPEFGLKKDLTVQIKAGETVTRVLSLE